MTGRYLRWSAVSAAVIAAAAAWIDRSATAEPMQSIGPGEGEVAIVAWAGYIERGETDPAYDWVTSFEQETGCKVSVKTAASSDEMVSLMNAGGFDLVTASGDASLRLIAGNTVQEVNVGLVPSWSTVDQRLQNAPWHTVGGKHYGVPYQWGSNVLLYNASVFENAPQSWNVIFENMTLPDGKSNEGRVQAYYGPIYIADAALYLKHSRPDLGITDPYALDQTQFDAAIELLSQQRKLIQRYWSDPAVQADDFTNEGVIAAPSWPYQVNLLRSGGKVKVGSTVPVEGATGWADTTMLHANAAHPNCAYMWLEHSVNPKLQGDLAAWFGSVPAVPTACQGNELLGEKGCEVNGMGNFRRISFWKTPVADCGEGRTCVPYKDWVSAYLAIQSGS